MDSTVGGPQGPGPGPASGPGPMPHPQLMDGLKAQHDLAASHFSKLGKAADTMGKVRAEMDKLAQMGDSVEPDDVIEAAGALVGAGLAPAALAQLLSDMPSSGGEQLAAWVQQHDQMLQQREQQNQALHGQARHELAASALRGIAGHSMGPQPGPPGGLPLQPPSGGPLNG